MSGTRTRVVRFRRARFFNLNKAAESAYRRYARGAVVQDDVLTTGAVSRAMRILRAGYLTLDDAIKVNYLFRRSVLYL